MEFCLEVNKEVEYLLSDAVTVGSCFLFTSVILSVKLEELLHGVLLEEVAVSGKFISDVLSADLSQSTSLSVVGECTSDILSKELDDLKGVLVISEGFNEKGIGETSHLGEVFDAVGDFSKSAFSPSYPSVGVFDLGFDVFSGGSGIVEVILVDVGDLGEFSDDISTDLFVSGVLLIGGNLDIKVFCLEVSKEIVD